MTPEAVIFRYLETAHRQPLPVESFVQILSADADLLGRWLTLTRCPADPEAFTRTIRELAPERVHSLAQAQAWAVLPVAGSARLGLDQWQAVLRSAFLAEVLAEQVGLDNPVQIRWLTLLAVSGINLAHDDALLELSAFRGVRHELLVDASTPIKIFGVVDAFEVLDEYEAAQLAQRLLDIDSENFADLVEWAADRCRELLRALKFSLAADDETDWANRLWVQQQIATLSELLDQANNAEAIQTAHELVSRSLFRQAPCLLVQARPGEDRFAVLPDRDVVVHLDSDASRIAQSLREGESLSVSDSADLSVGDRQLLRRMHTEEALCLPLGAGERRLGALLFVVDEDVDQDFAMAQYAEALGQKLKRHTGLGNGEQSLLRRYRQREEKRLRELVHEANNPLSVVQNYLHILEMRLAHEPTALEQLSMIGNELGRAAGIIQRARELPPLEDLETAAEILYSEFDLVGLARRTVELHSGYARDQSVGIELDVPSGAVVLLSDEQRLSQILNNLVRNAIEAAAGFGPAAQSPGAVRVTVGVATGVYREGLEGAELYVRDTGPGLPRSVLESLAEPKESSKGGDHAGLGLHIVHRLIAELGGNIDVRTAPGQGATFNLFLPLKPR